LTTGTTFTRFLTIPFSHFFPDRKRHDRKRHVIERITEESISSESENNSIHSCKISSALRFQGRHFPSYIPQTEKKDQSFQKISCYRTENENGKNNEKKLDIAVKFAMYSFVPHSLF
jgi:hypothetical protein